MDHHREHMALLLLPSVGCPKELNGAFQRVQSGLQGIKNGLFSSLGEPNSLDKIIHGLCESKLYFRYIQSQEKRTSF